MNPKDWGRVKSYLGKAKNELMEGARSIAQVIQEKASHLKKESAKVPGKKQKEPSEKSGEGCGIGQALWKAADELKEGGREVSRKTAQAAREAKESISEALWKLKGK